VEGLDDEFPFDIVICIAEAIEAKPAGPAPPGASTIKIYRPIAAATGALTDGAKEATNSSIHATGMGGMGFVLGGCLTLQGSNLNDMMSGRPLLQIS
jgi:hypothetical protein